MLQIWHYPPKISGVNHYKPGASYASLPFYHWIKPRKGSDRQYAITFFVQQHTSTTILHLHPLFIYLYSCKYLYWLKLLSLTLIFRTVCAKNVYNGGSVFILPPKLHVIIYVLSAREGPAIGAVPSACKQMHATIASSCDPPTAAFLIYILQIYVVFYVSLNRY